MANVGVESAGSVLEVPKPYVDAFRSPCEQLWETELDIYISAFHLVLQSGIGLAPIANTDCGLAPSNFRTDDC